MFRQEQIRAKAGGRWIGLRLLAFVLLLGVAFSAQAATLLCSDFPGGVIDGNNPAHDAAMDSASTFGIDRDCTIKNFPQSNPLDLTLINFNFPNQASYLIIFDNVYYIGGMSCNDPTQSDFWIWWVNGSYNTISTSCQDFILPVDSIVKQNPAGTATAAIGVPFTYTLTLPVLVELTAAGYDETGLPETEALGKWVIRDDLTATGAALTYVSNIAHLVNPDNSITPLGSLNVTTPDNKVLEFSYLNNPALPVIPAGTKLVIELTVVLDDVPTNTPGTQFINTATWQFAKAIDLNEDGVIDPLTEVFDPLPGQSGVTPPMTIVGPNLVVNKSGSETALNLGILATFTIDVQNTGGADAWDVTVLDRLPPFSGGAGMCDYNPVTSPLFSARIVAADGVTLVRNLTAGTDYNASYTGAPACQLSLTMTDAGGPIAPNQHLIITYQSQLDAATTTNGAALTNVAGATQWFSAVSTSPYPRHTENRTLTDGTPSIVDHQDSYTLTAALSGYYFQKTVQNLTTGENPATTAAPGDRLRYRVRIFNFTEVINNVTVSDTLNPALFDLGSFAMVVPPPAGSTFTWNGGTGQLQIVGNPPPLNLIPPTELVFEFEINLAAGLANGTVVPNQASFSAIGPPLVNASSDDPYVNGIAAPGEPADPTTVVIRIPGPLAKVNPVPATATIGQQFTYTITVPATPVDVPLYDVRILDNLGASAASLGFVSATANVGGTILALSNTSGSNTNLVLENTATGLDIPAGGQAVITVTVELLNTITNNIDLTFINSASYTYNRANGNNALQSDGAAGSTANMTVVEPVLTATKTASNVTAGKLPTDPAAVGDVLEYVVTIPNSGTSTAYDTNIADTLPVNVSLVASSATALINGVAVAGFVAAPNVLSGGVHVWGRGNNDNSLDIPAGQTLVLSYRVTVLTVYGAPLNNSVYVDWTSLQGPQAGERTGSGCPVITAPDDYCFGPVTAAFPTIDTTSIVKSVVSDSWNSGLSTGTDSTLRIGDTVVYRLALTLREGQLQNVVVTDTLPVGLVFESVVSVNGDATAPYSASGVFSYADIPAASVPSPGQTGTLTWNLGTITNPVDNNAANDTFVIEYRARVLKDTLAHSATMPLTNNVLLSYTGSDPAAPRLNGSTSITVLQPIMTTPVKSATGFTSPASVNVVTDVMPFHLESCNATGLAPAYSVMFTDQLATQLNETTLTTPEVRVGGTLLTAGTDYTYTPPAVRGGTMIFVLNTPVNPGQCATIDYTIGFYNDFGPNQTWDNTITVDEYWSLQTPTTTGQRYGPLGPTGFTMTNSTTITAPIKTLLSPAGNEATIGDEVVYRIAVPGTVSNAALFDVVVTDTLHPSLVFVSATATLNGSPVALTNNTTGNNVSLGIAQIPAGQQAIIELHTRVANNNDANAGVTFANSASYTYAASPGGAPISGGSDATDTPLRIVEPLLAVTKGVTPNTPPSAGTILTYTLNLTASGGTPGDNYSNAYDVSIVDTLSLGLAYVPNSAMVAGTPVNPTISGDGITTPQVLNWNTGLDLPEGTAAVVTYQVQVLSGVGANQILRNDVRVAWTGHDGVDANERTGTGTPAYNDYFTTAFTTLTTPAPGALSKQNPATTTVTIGQPFTYTISVPQVAATTNLYDVKIIDNLPAGVVFVGVTKLSSWGTWTPINSGTATNVVITDSSGQGIDVPAGQRIEIALTVVLVDDVATNYSGRQFSNTASYTYNQVDNNPATEQPGAGATTGNLTIIGPDNLTLEKSGPTEMSPGVPGTFTLNVHNAGTGTAWGLTVTDLLPNPTPGGMCDTAPTSVTAQMTLADGVTPVGGPLVAGTDFTVNFSGAPGCILTITMQSAAGAIPADYRLIITYQALLDLDNLNGTALTNIAGATQWFSAAQVAGATRHTYTRVLTNGTVGTLDHEDAHTVNTVTANGIVYDSLTRQPLAGATVTMRQASTGIALPVSCFNDPAQQNQVTTSFGYYRFDLNFSQPECPAGGDYLIAVTAAPAGYVAAPSQLIPPTTSAATAAYDVPLCPADAIPSTDYCEAQVNNTVPGGVAATTYYLHLTLDNGQVPQDSQIFNNHIPVDPARLDAGVNIRKTSSLINVTRGQMVPYMITVTNNGGGTLQDLAIVDTLPPGFKYVAGSSRYDGYPVEPVVVGNGRQLRWENVALLPYEPTRKEYVIKLLLVVSSGVGEGEYVNQAQVFSILAGAPVSGIATATVRVMPDPTFDCTDIIGKVFDDANLNGVQDAGEKGLPGVRVVSARGLIAKTDAHGRFHITCAAVPNEMRGSNFILKVDDRSLPAGYRLTTENPLVQRVTRGKAIKFNFGATVHRVVRLDMADGVFEPGTTAMRPQWKPRLGLLVDELRKGPAVLRLSYLADVEDAALVQARLKGVEREMSERWAALNCCYRLTVETEVYWRRGAEPVRKGLGP